MSVFQNVFNVVFVAFYIVIFKKNKQSSFFGVSLIDFVPIMISNPNEDKFTSRTIVAVNLFTSLLICNGQTDAVQLYVGCATWAKLALVQHKLRCVKRFVKHVYAFCHFAKR